MNKIVEAKTGITGHNQGNIFGVRVDSSPKEEVIKTLMTKLQDIRYNKTIHRPFFVVTAYSESLLQFHIDEEFRKAVTKADLVTADGVSVLAGMDYLNNHNISMAREILKILQEKYGQRATGVGIFKSFLGQSNNYRIFLFGGWNGVAKRLAQKYNCGWSEEDLQIIEKINAYKPDILFVALGRFKQEKWIAQHLKELKVKVVIGVGSAFDEVAEEGVWKAVVPGWVEQMGLKWLWRGLHDIKHWSRIWNAVVVFPYLLWKEKHHLYNIRSSS